MKTSFHVIFIPCYAFIACIYSYDFCHQVTIAQGLALWLATGEVPGSNPLLLTKDTQHNYLSPIKMQGIYVMHGSASLS